MPRNSQATNNMPDMQTEALRPVPRLASAPPPARPLPLIRLSKRSILTYSYAALEQTGRHKLLPPDAWEFLTWLVDEDATHAATIYENGELIAWLRVTKVRHTLFAQGTWVAKEHRGRGLGKALWRHTLSRLKPRRVEVTVVSEEGAALVKSLRRDYPEDLFQ